MELEPQDKVLFEDALVNAFPDYLNDFDKTVIALKFNIDRKAKIPANNSDPRDVFEKTINYFNSRYEIELLIFAVLEERPKVTFFNTLAEKIKATSEVCRKLESSSLLKQEIKHEIKETLENALKQTLEKVIPKGLEINTSALEARVRSNFEYQDAENFISKYSESSHKICIIRDNDDTWLGTGFLVGENLVLTNYHVVKAFIDNPSLKRDIKFVFDYKRLPNGKIYSGITFNLAKDALNENCWSPYHSFDLQHNDNPDIPDNFLDYAVLKLEGHPSKSKILEQEGTSRGYFDLEKIIPYEFPSNSPLFILHHPEGKPLKLSVDSVEEKPLNENGNRVRYRTNTEHGSSGSPCFDIHFNLVALHHAGDPDCDKNSQQNARYNQGIPINKIRDDLAKKKLNKSTLRNGNLEGKGCIREIPTPNSILKIIETNSSLLRTLVPEKTFNNLEEQAKQCWERYNKVTDILNGFSYEEREQATEQVLNCVCKELKIIKKVNKEIPEGELKDWWEAYCKKEFGSDKIEEAHLRKIMEYLPGSNRPTSLQELENIESLQSFSEYTDDTVLFYLKELKRLKHLNLHNVRITNEGLQHIGEMKNLKELILQNLREVSDRGIKYLQNLTDLETFHVTNVAITNKGLSYLKNFSKLKKLCLNGTRISNRGLKNLANLKNLEELQLYNTSISDQSIKYIKQLKYLRKFDLRETYYSDEGIDQLKKIFKGCSIQHCKKKGPEPKINQVDVIIIIFLLVCSIYWCFFNPLNPFYIGIYTLLSYFK